MSKTIHDLDPMDVKLIRNLLKPTESNRRRLNSRENNVLEFKEAFNWGNRSDYAKTIAAFANARGGYIVFGVKNSPREVVGLQSQKFEEIDSAIITEYLGTAFSPEIHWTKKQFTVQKTFKIGVLYVYEGVSKPVICMKNDDKLKEGEIYYRYRARTERIKYAELKLILDHEKEREKRFWTDHIQRIAKIGVSNVGIFNSLDGTVSGPGGIFLISEEILPKLKFVKEGHFSESEGAPALKLIGQVQPISGQTIQPTTEKILHRTISGTENVLSFLRSEVVSEPLEFVKAICLEGSSYYPVYYFVALAKTSYKDVIGLVKASATRNSGRTNLLKRLEGEYEDLKYGSVTAETPAAKIRSKFLAQIKSKSVPSTLSDADLRYFCEAVTHLKKKELEWDYLSVLLKNLFNHRYQKITGSSAGALRKAICHLDVLLYQAQVRAK